MSSLGELLKDGPSPELLTAIQNDVSYKALVPLLDTELERQEVRLRDLRAYRNMLAAPIHNLPAEIISRVFLYYASEECALFDLRWTCLLFVCRRWRDIGNSSPPLWSFIDLGKPSHDYSRMWTQLARLVAQRNRAGDWPLTIKCALYGSCSSDIVNMYDPFFWKPEFLRSLDINMDVEALCAVLGRMASFSHPLLKFLRVQARLRVLEDNVEEGDPQAEHPIHLPSALLGRAIPHLEILELWDVIPDWSTIRNITSLHVSLTSPPDPEHKFALRDLIDALSRCPQLESLKADIPPVPALDPLLCNGATLSKLCVLHLRGNWLSCLQVLTCIIIPPSATLACNAPLPSGPVYRPLALYFRRHYRSVGAPTIKGLAFDAPDHCYRQFTIAAATDTEFHDTILKVDYPTCFQFMSYPRTQPALRQIIRKTLHALPLQSVTHIWTSSVNSLTEKTWRTLIALVPSATTISVSPNDDADTLMDALHWFLMNQKCRPFAQIHINASLIRRTISYCDEEEREALIASAKAAFESVIVYLDAAKAAGLPLDVLQLTESIFPDGVQLKDLFGKLVQGVILDGRLVNKEIARQDRQRSRQNREELIAKFPELAHRLASVPGLNESDDE
ncbi:hypothetical protein K488DRAFT_90297 [Vararia minispora EC-137]|uniref:Uncharacterized protein n=1 Tax=Vararia minispora EC-137 TaxID=1314806 RepID=A0ACB8Q7Y8_9AGAM|nr:hypothetical protein K488DRAFT_90297 [Vararia minispora EC-137]